MKFKENLKEIRIKNKYTQETLSKALNIPKGTIQNWEQGKNQPKYEILEQLTKILDCDYNDLLK